MRLRILVSALLEWAVIVLHVRRYGGGRPASLAGRLIFVCTGNICRSPYAEAVARSMGFEAISAGTATTPGLPADARAIHMARMRGVDLSAHRTARWSDVELRKDDVVVALTLRHAVDVTERVRAAGCTLTLLGAFSRSGFGLLSDPYGREPAVFRRVFDRIDKLLREMHRSRKVADRPPPSPLAIIWKHCRWLAGRIVKDFIGRIIVYANLHEALLRRRAVVVAFHSVVPGPSDGTLRCGVRDFERYCRFFARHWRVCSLSELEERVCGGQALDGELVITFDDGYADNAEIAAPILAKYGLPATFFVSTRFVDSFEQAHWDMDAGVQSRWMTESQVRQLHEAGHEIGAHTRTHCDLGRVPEPVAAEEIAGSRDDIARWTGSPPRHFAVPYGREFEGLPRIVALMRELGFRTVMLCRGGVVHQAELTKSHVWERVPITPGDYLSPYGWMFDLARDARLSASIPQP